MVYSCTYNVYGLPIISIEVNIEGKPFIGYGLYHTQWMYVSMYFVHNLCYVFFGTWCTSGWSPLVEPWRDRDQKMEEDMNPHSNWLHPDMFGISNLRRCLKARQWMILTAYYSVSKLWTVIKSFDVDFVRS